MRYILLLSLLVSVNTLRAQVEYQLDYLPEEDRYQFSFYSTETYPVPSNMIGTFQVTFVTETGTVELADLQNSIPGVIFSLNSITRAPASAPGNDYFSVGLTTMAITDIPLQADTEIAVFTFANTMDCAAPVALIDHSVDPFYLDPEKTANVGNSLSLLPSGADVYSANRGDGRAHCDTSVGTESHAPFTTMTAYPNPVLNELRIAFDLPVALGAAELQLTDTYGRVLRRRAVQLDAGPQTYTLPTAALPAGMYRAVLVHAAGVAGIGTVMKR